MRHPRLMLALVLTACGDGQNDTRSVGSSGAGGGTAGNVGGGGIGATSNGGVTAGGAGATAGGVGATSNGGATAGSGATPNGGNMSGGAGATAGSGGTSDGGTTSVGNPSWETLPNLAGGVRQEHAVVALEGRVCVIGGFAPAITASVECYDPGVRTWSPIASFPVPLHHANAGVVDGRIYVLGYMYDYAFSTTGEAYVYDPGTDAWTTAAPMPTGRDRAAAGVAVRGGEIYVIGGGSGSAAVSVDIYDPTSNAWRSGPDLPAIREHLCAGTVGDLIVVAGGRDGSITGHTNVTLTLSNGGASWQEVAPMPTSRGGCAGATLAGRFHVFGGEGDTSVISGVFPDAEAYDPVTNTWEVLPPLPVPRHGFGAATVGDVIYLPGGATQQAFGAVSDVEAFSYGG